MSDLTGDPAEAARRQRLAAIIRADPVLMPLLTQLRALDLPQWRLVAGCLYQTVWNQLTGQPPGTGIKDYDLIYFDDRDLGWAAEHRVIEQVAALTPLPVEVRNQARVHLWFEQHFGTPYSPLPDADQSLLRYAAIVHAVGVRLEADDQFDIIAPFGLADLFNLVIRPNRALDNRPSYLAKAERARALWPTVTVIPWD